MRAQTMWIRIGHLGVMTALVMVMVLSCLAPARADGKFINVSRVGVGKDPTIRSQSAIIVHRDGVQTLIVGSRIDVEAGSMGWILPLPAEPTEIGLATVGMLQTMETLLQPRVWRRHDLVTVRFESILAFGFCALLTLLLISHRAEKAGRTAGISTKTLLLLMWTGMVIFIVVSLMFVPLGAARDGSMLSGIVPLQAERIGPYDVHVVRADDGAAINGWCAANGIALSSDEQAVVESYIREGWCFLTAVLAPEATGVLQQPPLIVTLPIARPVYPMRLTGVTDQPVELDLFIIASTGMRCDGLRTWWRDRMEIIDDPEFSGRDLSGRTIGHPGIARLLWDGAVVSRLHARLTPEAMRNDLTLLPDSSEPYRQQLIRASDAAKTIFWKSVFGLGLTMLVVALFWNAPRVRIPLAAGLTVLSIGIPLLFVLRTFDIHSLPDDPASFRHFMLASHNARKTAEWFAEQDASFRSSDDLRKAFVEEIGVYEQELVIGSDAPNGVLFEERDGFWYIVIHNAYALPTEHRVGRVE